MAHNHPPRFLAIVNDARSRIRETTVDEVRKRLDRWRQEDNSSWSTSAKTANSTPTTSPEPSTSAKASSSAISRQSIPTSRPNWCFIAEAASAPPWPPTICRRWATQMSSPWTAAFANGARRRTRWRSGSKEMDKAVLILRWVFSAIVGGVLLIWANPLSVRYNAWTTSFRERHPNINPPPTPEWRRRNTTIFAWILRIFGLFLALLSVLALLSLQNSH